MAPKPAMDVVARLHGLYQKKSDSAHDQLPVLPLPPPQSIRDALSTLSFQFERLPRSLQHALMWDAGYATMADGDVFTIRTQCGLSATDALALSSAAVPTCALLVSPGTTNEVAWFVFSDTSPLPVEVVSSTSALAGPTTTLTTVPCSTVRQEDASLCLPKRSSLMAEWLAEHAAQLGNSRTLPGNVPHLDRMLTATGSDPNTTTAAGLAADFTTALYALRAAGASLPRVDIRTGVPPDVEARLDAFRLPFKSLTGMLQRAVLWDSGYAVVKHPDSSNNVVDVVPVYVKCGLRMADIAPDRVYFESTGCSVQDCSTYNSSLSDVVYSLRARDCPMTAAGNKLSDVGSKVLAISRCAVPTSVDALDVPLASTTTVWALGTVSMSEKTAVPRLRLQQHPASTSTAKWYAIHSVPIEVTMGACPTLPSFIIPCVTVDQTSLQQEWCRPVYSDLIATWLRQEQHQEMALATLILLAGAILVALALDLFADRKPRFFANARVSASLPSLTSSLFDGGENDETPEQEPTNDGWSSVRSAESVRSER